MTTERFACLRELSGAQGHAIPGMRPLKVLQITNMYPSEERPHWGIFIRSQIESLANQGITSDILEVEGWRQKSNYLSAAFALPERAARGGYDLIHVHYGLTAVSCLGIRNIPMVVSFCGDDILGKPDSKGNPKRGSLILAALSKRASRRADSIIVKSAAMALALGPGFPDVEVIPNGVDFQLFRPIPRDEARRRLGWPLDQEILLFPANPEEPRKNFALAQAVESRLRDRNRPARLEWIYGRPQDDIVLAMAAADVMLSCSFQEGSPNAVKEALAMGLPIVATDVGDCRQLLQDVRPGAVAAGEAEAFTAAVAAILEQGAQRSNGRECARGLDSTVIAARVAAVYRRALAAYQGRTGH